MPEPAPYVNDRHPLHVRPQRGLEGLGLASQPRLKADAWLDTPARAAGYDGASASERFALSRALRLAVRDSAICPTRADRHDASAGRPSPAIAVRRQRPTVPVACRTVGQPRVREGPHGWSVQPGTGGPRPGVGAAEDSQADSAGSIPVTRSTTKARSEGQPGPNSPRSTTSASALMKVTRSEARQSRRERARRRRSPTHPSRATTGSKRRSAGSTDSP